MTTMIGYLRVSTEEQSSSGLGLDAQRDTIQRYADAHGWDMVWYVDEGLSAKSLDRPQLQAALTRLHVPPKRRDVDGIVVAKLDRLSRSVHDFSGILKRAAARKWAVVAIDLGVDTSTPTGKLVANVMMSVAEWEREVIGERTSAAMQAAKRAGKHMGRVSVLPEATGRACWPCALLTRWQPPPIPSTPRGSPPPRASPGRVTPWPRCSSASVPLSDALVQRLQARVRGRRQFPPLALVNLLDEVSRV